MTSRRVLRRLARPMSRRPRVSFRRARAFPAALRPYCKSRMAFQLR